MEFPVPRVCVSACLGFDHCRYNGQRISAPVVTLLSPYVEFIPLCPEKEIGLGVPRPPIRIVEEGDEIRVFQPATGEDVTEGMRAYIEEQLTPGRFDGFLLKSRSPSCGPWNVKLYSSKEAEGASKKGAGLFGAAALRRYPGLPLEDEGRLRNFALRDHFFISLFTLTRFRRMRDAGGGKAELIHFHTIGKLLFMAYNQELMRELGRIVAAPDSYSREEWFDAYEAKLQQLFAHPPHYTGMINSFQHAFGGVSEGLTAEERKFFQDTIEEYRDERIPASTVVRLLLSYAVRFDNRYLLDQLLLAPYPPGLTDISDSGKGRNY